MRVPFSKMSGAGNDFVLVDRARLPKAAGPALARRLCPRRTAVGADGLLLVRRRGPKGRPALEYYNADGSRAFCGNGSRCAAVWMRAKGWAGRRMVFDSSSGALHAEVLGPGRARVRMPDARVTGRRRARAAGRSWDAWLVSAGVPHAVVFVRGLARVDVDRAGRVLRRLLGANVDFVEGSGSRVRARTYERGVEAETLACGTGAVAAAAAWAARGLRTPLAVEARGGTLRVSLSPAGPGRFSEVWLEGPVETVYEGEIVL